MIQGNHFNHFKYFNHFNKVIILTILKATEVSKTAGLDNLSGHFLKDGAKFLSSDLCNLSITSEKFLDSCKVAKLKSLQRKSSLTIDLYVSYP